MDRISVSNIIKFRRKKSDTTRLTLIRNLNKPKNADDDSETGGDYWISSLSTISNVFSSDRHELLNEKIDDINVKHDASPYKRVRDMYRKNVEILHNFEDYDFSKLKPATKLTFLSKPADKSILIFRGVPVHIRPHHVFSFVENDTKQIGAVWFVSKRQGYTMEELGMFTDALFRYLSFNYSEEYEVNTQFCSTVDATDLGGVNYSQLIGGKVPAVLNETLDEIAAML